MLRQPPSPTAKPELRRRRSVEMYDRMEDRNWEEDLVTIEGETYLRIDGTNYRILDSGMTEFDNGDKPLVSVGARLSRELVILDPENQYLRSIYRKLREEVEDLDDKSIQNILDYTIKFARNYLRPDPGKLKGKVQGICADPKNYMQSEDGEPLLYKDNPVIELDTFIEEGAGLCRHHALFMAYLVNNLVLDRLLPAGNVFSHRDTVQSGGAHVWTIYKPIQAVAANNRYDFYLADSLWHKEAFNLKDWAPFFEEWGYGERAIQYCISRHNKPDLETVAYSKIDGRDVRIKEAFIYDLLDATPQLRRKFLNHQLRLGGCEAIKDALTSSTKYHNERNYNALLTDLDRVLDETLYNRYYAEIENGNDRQQFVLGLLNKSEDARNVILDDADLEDLRELHDSLTYKSADRKFLFLQFDSYQALLEEVDSRINIKLLHERPFNEIAEDENRELFLTGLLLGKARERETILDKQHLDDLYQMRSLLIENRDFYGNFDNFETVLKGIDKRIEVNELHAERYDSIEDVKIRQEFISELLKRKPAERREVLEHQDLADLKHLKASIASRKTLYQNHTAYQPVMHVLTEQIKLKEFLYNEPYHNLDSHNEMKKFVTGLLLCPLKDERRLILDKQDSADLKHMRASLTSSDSYQGFAAYQSVKDEIDKIIMLRSIYLIKNIIMSGQLEVKSDWTTRFWVAAGTKITIAPDNKIRVPTSGKVIFDQINAVDLESANLATLTALVASIQASASDAAQHDHKDRTKNTRLLLNILKNAYANPATLLERLESLHHQITASSESESSLEKSF